MTDIHQVMQTLADVIVDLLGNRRENQEIYYNQQTSPLRKRGHINAIKSGNIRGFRHGNTYFAKRTEVDAYIESKPVRSSSPDAPAGNDLPGASATPASLLAGIGRNR